MWSNEICLFYLFWFTSAQLHHFADASEVGYGTATYLLLCSSDGKMSSILVIGKAREAPLKPITIPRLKLTAAGVAVRMDRLWRKELQMTLLAFCLLEWHHLSAKVCQEWNLQIQNIYGQGAQWRYVSTLSNPASRGLGVKSFLQDEQWMFCPQFLQAEEQWPANPDSSEELSEQDDSEFRTSVLANAVSAKEVTIDWPYLILEQSEKSDELGLKIQK